MFSTYVLYSLTHIHDYLDTNAALHFYSHDNVRTANGVLNITTQRKVNAYRAFNEKTKKFYADKKYIQSGMVQGWNKFCMIGGIIEFSASLPGDPSTGGLWPACKYSIMMEIAHTYSLVSCCHSQYSFQYGS